MAYLNRAARAIEAKSEYQMVVRYICHGNVDLRRLFVALKGFPFWNQTCVLVVRVRAAGFSRDLPERYCARERSGGTQVMPSRSVVDRQQRACFAVRIMIE